MPRWYASLFPVEVQCTNMPLVMIVPRLVPRFPPCFAVLPAVVSCLRRMISYSMGSGAAGVLNHGRKDIHDGFSL